MSPRFKALVLVASLLFGVFGVTSPASAGSSSLKEGSDKAAVLFDPIRPIEVSVMRELGGPPLSRSYLNSPTYRKATIKISLYGTKKYVVFRDVGVRQKGSFTRRFEKPSLKIKLDAFVKDQKFLGITRLTLNAMGQDLSQVHEVTAYKLFREAGIPAPRAGYARVKIDGAYQGLYLNLESIDNDMLGRWFDSTAHLYSGPRPCDLTSNNTCYQASIGSTDRFDLNEASNLHSLSGQAWWDGFQKLADSDTVLKFMAAEIFLGQGDGYSHNRNNHYIHFDESGKFTLMPWGLDQTFSDALKHRTTWDGSQPTHLNSASELGTLFTHCLDYKPCHERLQFFGFYIARVAEKIDLIAYKNQVDTLISQPKYSKNDVVRVDEKTENLAQSWVTDFINLSKRTLLNYRSLHKAIPLSVVMPEEVRVGQTLRPSFERSWEPGVRISYQWFVGDEPIDGATSRYLKTNKSLQGMKVKLQVTLQKDSVRDTVYFSKSLKVLPKA